MTLQTDYLCVAPIKNCRGDFWIQFKYVRTYFFLPSSICPTNAEFPLHQRLEQYIGHFYLTFSLHSVLYVFHLIRYFLHSRYLAISTLVFLSVRSPQLVLQDFIACRVICLLSLLMTCPSQLYVFRTACLWLLRLPWPTAGKHTQCKFCSMNRHRLHNLQNFCTFWEKSSEKGTNIRRTNIQWWIC